MHKRELAEFFHKSGNTFMKHKDIYERYCMQLEDYAAFEQVRGGVNILEIFDDSPYDEITFDFNKGIKEAIEKAPISQYIKNGKILTSGSILHYILDTQASRDERIRFEQDEKLRERYQRRIAYRLRKTKLLESVTLDKYWGCVENNAETELEAPSRLIVPLLKKKKEFLLESYSEMTKEDKDLLEKLIDEEERNNEEHSKIAVYHLLDNAEYYKGYEKEFYQEAKKLCKPFYRAMKRFNEIKDRVYISKGTLIMCRE